MKVFLFHVAAELTTMITKTVLKWTLKIKTFNKIFTIRCIMEYICHIQITMVICQNITQNNEVQNFYKNKSIFGYLDILYRYLPVIARSYYTNTFLYEFTILRFWEILSCPNRSAAERDQKMKNFSHENDKRIYEIKWKTKYTALSE